MIYRHLVSFLACLGAAAFFAASETALMSVSLSGWEQLRKKRPTLETDVFPHLYLNLQPLNSLCLGMRANPLA